MALTNTKTIVIGVVIGLLIGVGIGYLLTQSRTTKLTSDVVSLEGVVSKLEDDNEQMLHTLEQAEEVFEFQKEKIDDLESQILHLHARDQLMTLVKEELVLLSELDAKTWQVMQIVSNAEIAWAQMEPTTQEILKDKITDIVLALKVGTGWDKPAEEIAQAVVRAIQ